MQRDAYGSLVRFPHARKVYLRIMQMDGRVMHENVMHNFFKGYSARRFALMTYTAGQDPSLPRLPRDVVVPTFEALLRIHKPHYMYHLMPLLSADVDTFAVMQYICSSPGSPFILQDRIEANGFHLRLGPLCHGRERVCEFMKDDTAPSELLVSPATRTLPISAVSFQGVLFREGGVAQPPSGREAASSAKTTSATLTVTTHDVCSESAIQKRAIMTRFFQSPIYASMHSGSELYGLAQNAGQQWHVMAFKRRVGGFTTAAEIRLRAQMLEKARRNNIILCERVDDGMYEYVH